MPQIANLRKASGSNSSLRSAETSKSLSLVHQYIVYLLLSHRIRRDLLLVETMTSSDTALPADPATFKIPGGRSKTEEAVKSLAAVIKLYDAVLQSMGQLRSLALVEEREGVRLANEGLEAYFHATRRVAISPSVLVDELTGLDATTSRGCIAFILRPLSPRQSSYSADRISSSHRRAHPFLTHPSRSKKRSSPFPKRQSQIWRPVSRLWISPPSKPCFRNVYPNPSSSTTHSTTSTCQWTNSWSRLAGSPQSQSVNRHRRRLSPRQWCNKWKRLQPR